jgi:hypothetical protein
MPSKKISHADRKPLHLSKAGVGRAHSLVASGKVLKSTRRAKKHVADLGEETVRIALTETDISRIDDICLNPPSVTEHVRAAIVRHRKLVGA